jgi:hypothetical protein
VPIVSFRLFATKDGIDQRRVPGDLDRGRVRRCLRIIGKLDVTPAHGFVDGIETSRLSGFSIEQFSVLQIDKTILIAFDHLESAALAIQTKHLQHIDDVKGINRTGFELRRPGNCAE